MAKKFVGIFTDAKGKPIKGYGPVYGEWTDEKIADMRKAGVKAKASYCEISRVTGGSFVPFFSYDIRAGRMYRRDRPPAGSRIGPGYY